eukprot:gnl/TRDRNA2_/TRDRNA2_196510_c0_seq1.p1 gnl/TRDRNA2_/TRDRNA2_196510_c0~~gnl/TRDRNA2_/TRDRNA2_196510_c0_seq1.p1  ORF type:complete len:251 (+),score=35.13 gnl/TRDRNA2_/TRDRNA2_196510_c0_seq1:66-755(+)
MLAADKLLLTSTIRKNATELKGKELELHKDNFDAVGTQAAVLAGFATVALIELEMPETINPILASVFYFFSVITLVANLRCVAMTTCITVMGTGLALRGPDGSMDRAVEGMYKERRAVFSSFAVGIVACHCTALMACWIKMITIPAIICSGVLLWAMLASYRLARSYCQYFGFSEEEAVTFDELLGSAAVNNEAFIRMLGMNNQAVQRLLRQVAPAGLVTTEHSPETQV